MKTTIRNITLLVFSFCAGILICYGLLQRSPTPAAQPIGQADTTTAQRCFDTLLAATTADDYDQFISVADDAFRRKITPTVFHSVSQSLAPRMQSGCTPTYLGELRQKGAQISLWRLAFADGGADLLARMSISQDRVYGFLIAPAF